MKRKIVWILVSCLMVLSLVLVSCGPAAPEEEEEEEVIVPEEEEEEEEEEEVIVPEEKGPIYGGTITVCQTMSVSSPNPIQSSGAIQEINSHTHDRLGKCDWTRGPAGTGEYDFQSSTFYYPYTGALVESWEQLDTYTFILHLRQGVHWHNKPPVNGREFVADDVLYLANYLYTHPQIRNDLNPRQVESITALDKYTIELKSNTLDHRFLETYMIGVSTWICPPEPEATYGEGFIDINGHCGTGPFILTDFLSNSSATLDRNPDYWGYDEVNPENQLPYVDRVKVLQITDKSTYLAALRTGKIDFLTEVSTNDAESLMVTSPEMGWTSYPYCFYNHLCWRQDKEELPFSDIRVRKALSMAIDREAIIEGYLHGQGEVVMHPLQPWMDEFIPIEELPESTSEQFEYNPEKAKQYLAEAGYPGGFQTECITTEAVVETLQILVAYWRVIGVDCEIKVLDGPAYANMAMGKKYEQMAYGRMGSSSPIYNLDNRTSTAFLNIIMHFDPEYDATVALLREATDKAEQKRLIQEAYLQFLAWVPRIQFPGEHVYNFWWPWLKNCHGATSIGPQGFGQLNARIWFDQELKKEMGY